jgi:DNA-binding NarL/FixJ family response regulator
MFLKNNITQKETEIIELVANGLSNKEIAEKLQVEETTVKVHLNHILGKLQLKNRAQLIVQYYTLMSKINKED